MSDRATENRKLIEGYWDVLERRDFEGCGAYFADGGVSTGEHVALPFVSVMELRDAKITRWWDYFNLATLLDGAPQWWLDHIASGYR